MSKKTIPRGGYMDQGRGPGDSDQVQWEHPKETDWGNPESVQSAIS